MVLYFLLLPWKKWFLFSQLLQKSNIESQWLLPVSQAYWLRKIDKYKGKSKNHSCYKEWLLLHRFLKIGCKGPIKIDRATQQPALHFRLYLSISLCMSMHVLKHIIIYMALYLYDSLQINLSVYWVESN